MKKNKKKKFYTTEEVMSKIDNFDIPVVNENLEKKLKNIVKKLIAKEFRKEALDVLLKTDSKLLGDFLYYYYSNVGNVACMVIDRAKDKLVKMGKIKQKKTDGFGGIFPDEINENKTEEIKFKKK